MTSVKEYDFIDEIGHGTYGVVHKVRRKRGDNVQVLVCKQIQLGAMKKIQREHALQEAKLMSKFECPYIVKGYSSFIEDRHLNIIMEFCDSGDLESYIRKLDQDRKHILEERIWSFFLQMAAGYFTNIFLRRKHFFTFYYVHCQTCFYSIIITK